MCAVQTCAVLRCVVLHCAGSDLDFALAAWVSGPDGRQIELHEWNPLEQHYLVSCVLACVLSAALLTDAACRMHHEL